MVKKNEDLTKYVTCECGQLIYKSNLAGHKKRREHKKRMESMKEVEEAPINVDEKKEKIKNDLYDLFMQYKELLLIE